MSNQPVFKSGAPLFISPPGGGVLLPASASNPCLCCGTLPGNLDCCSRGTGQHCYFPAGTHRTLTLSGAPLCVTGPFASFDPNGVFDCFNDAGESCSLRAGNSASITLTSTEVGGVRYCVLSGAIFSGQLGGTNPVATLIGIAPSSTACAGFNVSGNPFSFNCDMTGATMSF